MSRESIKNDVLNFKVTMPNEGKADDSSNQLNNQNNNDNKNADGGSAKPLEINWEAFNKETEGEFKSLDDIKNLKKQASEYDKKLKEYEPILQEHKTFKQKLEEKEAFIKENLNPLKPFGGKKEKYIRFQLEDKYPDREDLIPDVMNIDKLSDIDAIILGELWNDPKADEDAIIEHYNKKFDTDLNTLMKTKPEDWDASIRFTISKEAREARAKLGGLPNEIQLPEDPEIINKQLQDKKNIELQANEATWKNLTSQEGFSERVFGELFNSKFFTKRDENGVPLKGEDGKELPPYLTWTVEPEVLKTFPEKVLQFVKTNGIPPTEENFSKIMEYFANEYFVNNKDKMFAKHETELLAKWKAQKAIDDHVPNLEINRGDGSGKSGEVDLSRQAYENFSKKLGKKTA